MLPKDFNRTSPPKVLDVGAGPITLLGKCLDGRTIDLTACDPLAPFYDEIADRHGVKRPVVTEMAFAEDLTAYYEPDTFDIVHCSNALDHSFDPVRGLEEMFVVTKLGGRIVLQHAVNEAVYGEYDGLHQWNFDEEGGHFIIWNKENRIDATALFSARSTVTTNKQDRWISVIVDKTSEAQPTSADHRARVRQLLSGLLMTAALPSNAETQPVQVDNGVSG